MAFFKERRNLVPKVDITTNYTYVKTQKQFENVYDEIMKLPYWVFDTETTGTDPHRDHVMLMQIGNRHTQFVIDTRTVNPIRLKDAFEEETLRKIMQNGVFDYLMMLGTFGVSLEGIRDTMLAELLMCKSIQKYGFGMEDLAAKYLHVPLDKEMQKSFINHQGKFSMRQLQYAALDCVVPDHILDAQLKVLQEENLVPAWKIECNAVPAFGDACFYGLNLDADAWEENIQIAEREKRKATEEFMSEAARHLNTDMFGVANINPGSPSQVLKLLTQIFGEDLCKDRDGKLGTGEEILTKISEKKNNPKIVAALMKIRESDKMVRSGTYGDSYPRHIHPKTGRFHPKLKQLGTETGRPSSTKPNVLNIPALPRYRTPWIGGPGRKILTDDYGACELRIMASMSGDPVMCKGFNEGLDYHTYTASQFITDKEAYLREYIPHPKGEAGKGTLGDFILDSQGNKIPNPNYKQLVPYDKVLKDQRSIAKTINFGLAYGMGAAKLANKLGIKKKEAREYIKKFNTTFKVLIAWLKENQEVAIIPRACSYQEKEKAKDEGREPRPDLGYTETFLGRRRYFKLPHVPDVVRLADKYQKFEVGKEEKTFQNDEGEDFTKKVPVFEFRAPGLKTLNYDPLNPWDDRMPLPVKKFHQRVAGIKREGGNSPIQGGNADITKIAMYELRKWFKKIEKERNNGEYLAHIALQVYDELVADVPESMAEEAAAKMDEIMREAGRRVIRNVPVETDCVIEDSWTKG